MSVSFASQWQGFLKRLWDLADGFTNAHVKIELVVATLTFDAATTRRVVGYLSEKGLVKNGRDDMVALTVAGIDELQRLGLI